MDLDNAIKAHSEWKVKFRAAIQGKQQLDAATISKDNVCPLGQWLHGEAKAKYSGLSSHARCLRDHAAFHTEAGKIAQTINAGKYVQAETMMSSNTPYTSASNAVGTAIIGLRKDAGV